MLRLRLLLPLLFCAPAGLYAADITVPSCQQGMPNSAAFEPTEGAALTRVEVDELQRLFQRLKGRWRGSMVEEVCMLSGANRQHANTAEMQIESINTGVELIGSAKREQGGTTRRFKRKFLQSRDGLRIDHPSAVGEVMLDHVTPTGLAYIQRYRTVHELPVKASPQQGPSTTASSTDLLGAVLGLAGVIGGENVVSSTTSQPAPEPERRSLVREERFRLDAPGANQLKIRQDFYTQGNYSGSKTWILRRH